jgi:hypothetical protein
MVSRREIIAKSPSLIRGVYMLKIMFLNKENVHKGKISKSR